MVTYPLNNVQYNAEDAELYNAVRMSGVWSGSAFDAEVTGNDTIVTIGEGLAWIANTKFSGKVVAQKEPKAIDLGAADPSYNRIDVVAIQFNSVENRTDIVVKKGVASSSPEMPARSTAESLYELYLYSVLRTAGSSVVSKSNITDLRDNREYCGYMQDSVKPGYAPSLMEHNKGDDFRFWVGTKTEYEVQKNTIPPNVFCVTTDDTAEADMWAAINGKAPAGYGLGGNTIELDNLNDGKKCGWYAFTKGALNSPFDYGVVMVMNRYGNQITQIAFNPNMGGCGEMCVRHFYDGTWSEWEYDNPPMKLNVEYRTIKRHNKKAVYVKRINHIYEGEPGISYDIAENVSDVVAFRFNYIKRKDSAYYDTSFLGSEFLDLKLMYGGLEYVVYPVSDSEVYNGATISFDIEYTKD